MKCDYLFVYGTLRRDLNKKIFHLLYQHSDFVGYGYVFGKLYEVDNYPGLKITFSGEDKVYGEVYKLRNPDIIFEVLDDYEECSKKFPEPHEYRRIKTNVHLSDGKKLSAWVYEYKCPTENLEIILSGNYKEYLQKK
jgi:gamma-glutamylcyclotransferase (GGCT)/AIG2-like uncharacterized protein YtfP